MNALENIEDFTLLLFLHMGRVDGSLHPNEWDTILERMDEIFPGDASMEQKLTTLENHYGRLEFGEAENILKEGFIIYSGVDPFKRHQIYEALFDIINANGRVSEEETQTLRFAKEWLTSP